LRRNSSAAAVSGLRKAINYLRGAADIGPGTTIKNQRRKTRAARETA
jgi:hypothetical protein